MNGNRNIYIHTYIYIYIYIRKALYVTNTFYSIIIDLNIISTSDGLFYVEAYSANFNYAVMFYYHPTSPAPTHTKSKADISKGDIIRIENITTWAPSQTKMFPGMEISIIRRRSCLYNENTRNGKTFIVRSSTLIYIYIYIYVLISVCL